MARKYTEDSQIERVDPLTTQRDIKNVERMLVTQGGRYKKYRKVGKRNLMLFRFGIFTGLRVSDIIKLKVSDVKDYDAFREKKTGKITRTHPNAKLRKYLNEYIDDLELADSDWLFPSTRGAGHVTRYQVYKCIKEAGDSCGIPHLGSHTMRKTFGRMWYEQRLPIETLQAIYNHSSEKLTRAYIGITQRDIDDQEEDFDPENGYIPKKRK